MSMNIERCWNDTDRGRRKQRKPCPGATLSTKNHTRTDLGLKLVLCYKIPTTNTWTLIPQCGQKVLGLIFFFKSKTHEEDTYLFLIQYNLNWHIYTLLGRPQFLKTCRNSSLWTFFNSPVTASWISPTSAKWSPCNFIFNFGKRK